VDQSVTLKQRLTNLKWKFYFIPQQLCSYPHKHSKIPILTFFQIATIHRFFFFQIMLYVHHKMECSKSHLPNSIHFISTPKTQSSNLTFHLCPSSISIKSFYSSESLIWFRCMNYILYILIDIRVSKWLKIYQNFILIYWALCIEIDLAMLIAYLY